MEEGSTGPGVSVLLQFLWDWHNNFGDRAYADAIIFDRVYGAAGVAAMQAYQRYREIDDDGGCGPETRKAMVNHDNFDFDDAVRRTVGTTSFYQPDGEIVGFHAPDVVGVESADASSETRVRAWSHD